MPTLQLRPASIVQQAQAPSISVPDAHVDLGTFTEGLYAFTKVTLAKQDANAVNKGKNAALELQKKMLPEMNKFMQANQAKESFGEDWVRFLDEATQRHMPNIGLGNGDREQEAFKVMHNRFIASSLEDGFKVGNAAFQAEQKRILSDNVSTASAGAEYMPQETLNQAYLDIAESLREGASQDPQHPGIITPAEARITFDSKVRDIAVGRLREDLKASPQLAVEVLGNGTASVTVPELDESLQIKGMKLVPLTSMEVAAIKAAVDKDITQSLGIERGRNDLAREKVAMQAQVLEMSATQRILNGEVGVAEEAGMVESPYGGFVMGAEKIRSLRQFEISMRDADANKPTTNTALFMQLQEQALDGKLPYGRLVQGDVAEGISLAHRKDLMQTQLNAQQRNLTIGDRVYKEELVMARNNLKRQFGVNGLLMLNESAAGLLTDVLFALDARTQDQYRAAVASGQDPREIRPMHIAQQIIAERQDALIPILYPSLSQLGKHLVKYRNLAKQRGTTMKQELDKDLQEGGLTRLEYNRQLLILNGLRRQGVTDEGLDQMINAEGTVMSLAGTVGAPTGEDVSQWRKLNGLMQWLWGLATDAPPQAQEE